MESEKKEEKIKEETTEAGNSQDKKISKIKRTSLFFKNLAEKSITKMVFPMKA